MFNFIKKKTTFKSLKTYDNKIKSQAANEKKSEKATAKKSKQEDEIPAAIEEVKKKLNEEFSLCSDFVVREIVLGSTGKRVIIACIDGYFDKAILAENVIEPMVNCKGDIKENELIIHLKNKILSISDLKDLTSFSDSVSGILSGDVAVYVDGEQTAFKLGLNSPEKRPVGEPDTETSLKGSREGFSENLRTNTVLLRRRIKNTKFKIESMRIGRKTNTDVAVCYVEGIVSQEVVQEVKDRLEQIDIDAVISSGYLEQFIQDGRYPLFPVVGNSEKPDKVAAKILEGRVAILSDGTPTVLTVPYMMIESFQAQEDYFGEYYFASLMRLLRVFSFFISVYLPGLYVAVTAFHQTIIPFKLMLTMAATREGIPFSAFVEALIMVVTFEILREAGIRMPRAIGQAVSIVGAIVLGDAAVSAGIASAPLVIIAALAGICSFIVPPLMKSGAATRLIILIAANIMGLMGIGFVTFMVTIYLCNKKSFGVPYLSPFAPLRTAGMKDALIITPVWKMYTRPDSLAKGRDYHRTNGKPHRNRGRQDG